ncbi:MAG: hypothetical protein ACI957_001114 [Verrucomicrobiales bacterium]|jgi:hypothetical protein
MIISIQCGCQLLVSHVIVRSLDSEQSFKKKVERRAGPAKIEQVEAGRHLTATQFVLEF